MPQIQLTYKVLVMDKNQNQFDTYSNNKISVTYNPKVCINAEKCAKGLSEVFRTSVIPWIKLDGSTDVNKIIAQIKQCPSGALEYQLKNTN